MAATKKTTTKKTTAKTKLVLYGVIDIGINGNLEDSTYFEGVHFYRATNQLNAVEQYLAADWDDYYGGEETDIQVFATGATTVFSAVKESWSIKEIKST